MHRSLIERIGLFSDLRYVQDYDYLMRCLIRVPEAVQWIDRPLLQYRLHECNTIMEDAIAQVRQPIEMLARFAPKLIQANLEPSRQAAFEEHLLRLASYIERDAKIIGSETWHELYASLQARIDMLEAKLNRSPLRRLHVMARQAITQMKRS